MKLAKTLLSSCALAFAASAFAVDYPEERGVVPSVVPPAPDENGVVRNVPAWRTPDGGVDSFFSRYDANRDGVISWEEAQQDSELLAVFDQADANRDRILSRAEFQDAAVLAYNERNSGLGGS